MSTPLTQSSGSLSTAGNVGTGPGVLTYAEATGGTLTVYDGSTSGNLLLTVTSSGVTPLSRPVQFSSTDGLYVTLSTGTGVVHYA